MAAHITLDRKMRISHRDHKGHRERYYGDFLLAIENSPKDRMKSHFPFAPVEKWRGAACLGWVNWRGALRFVYPGCALCVLCGSILLFNLLAVVVVLGKKCG